MIYIQSTARNRFFVFFLLLPVSFKCLTTFRSMGEWVGGGWLNGANVLNC